MRSHQVPVGVARRASVLFLGLLLLAGCGSAPSPPVSAPSASLSTAGSTSPGQEPASSPPVLVLTTGAPSSVQTVAEPVAGVPAIGPLFSDGLTSDHGCTASVVDSPGHDLLIAAAHCITGTGTGMVFAPGYDAGRTPYGTFTVQRVWADPSWVSHYDQLHDFAVLQVRDTGSGQRRVQDVTGAYELGSTPAAGTTVQVTGYLAGLDDAPIGCRTTIALSGPYPSFRCDRFADGTSGSPFVTDTATRTGILGTVVGLIGGLHEGGCTNQVSYSPPFGPGLPSLLTRATADDVGDALPGSGPDDC